LGGGKNRRRELKSFAHSGFLSVARGLTIRSAACDVVQSYMPGRALVFTWYRQVIPHHMGSHL
jgi:hypothetical protein